MWELFIQSASLFLKGKMFRDPIMVFRQSAIGVVIGLVILLALGELWRVGIPIPLWASAGISGLVTGLLMPYLFKDLKYA